MTSINPLLQAWDAPDVLPPFDRVRAEHFVPAFDAAIAAHEAEIAAIAGNGAAPTFGNTLAALDRSGRMLSRIELLFWNLASSQTSPALQAVEREMSGRLAAHHNATLHNGPLFARVDALHARRAELELSAEQAKLIERVHLDFTLAGARLEAAAKTRLAQIVEELATLSTRFSQNVLADEAAYELVLRGERDLAGLPEQLRHAAREAAIERGKPDAWVITLSRSLIVPFLKFSDRRDLREQAFRAWTRRGENEGATDNRSIARRILALRHEQAKLHGHATYADYALVDRMAGTPAAVAALLERVWGPAKARAEKDRDALRALALSRGEGIQIEPWDWRYYAEKVRKARYDFDESELKPYFPLDRMLEAAFDCAAKLFGIRFVARPDLKAYHADVRVFEVRDRAGDMIAMFLSDNFARPTKRGGAWMSVYRNQSRANGTLPIVVNNNNFAKAPEGEQTLLSADDVRTLFHEFGHGLHGMLSQVTYERLSGTNVLQDFVELPSQIFEHWAFEPEVLSRHALHHETGAPLPPALLERLLAARRFNQGFETVEYVSCALVDMALHAQVDPTGTDITKFEARELARIGMPREIVMRHRLPHFGHLFSGSAYAAGYYVYMWAEVLDCDGYDAFREAGSVFDAATAERLYRYVYSAGGTLDPRVAYRAFRGRDAAVEPMLADRGLLEDAVESRAEV